MTVSNPVTQALPDKAIQHLKYSAKPFRALNEAQQLDCATAIGIKVSLITGWELPAGQLAELFENELKQFLIEKYPTMNINEVYYAFRNYPAKDWGKQINLNLIDEVLSQYMSDRLEASKAEETTPLPVDKQISAPHMTDEEHIELGRLSVAHMHQVETVWNCYEVLRRLELMPQPDALTASIYKTTAKAKYAALMNTSPNYFRGMDVKHWIDNYRQKLAVIDYFKNEVKDDY